MNANRSPRPRRLIIFILAVFVFICILGLGLSALSNLLFPSESPVTGRLSDLDKARAAEALHLRRALGDTIWPGWAAADIPMLFYNEAYAFLTGYPDPPAGWMSIPEFDSRGGPWEAAPEDSIGGETYYRQALIAAGETPQAFIVRIGDRWVSTLLTADWMEIDLGNEFRGLVPPPVQPVIPYRLAARGFLSAAGGTDSYVCLILHESFHAYQAILAEDRLLAAEKIFNANASRYPYDDPAFAADWQTELDLLADAVEAETNEETLAIARRFLEAREGRRKDAQLDASLTDLERLKEWEEGLAKYSELGIWRSAFTHTGYLPSPSMIGVAGFSQYANFEQIWSQQIGQIRKMAADDGDLRFYYSGLAQAAILDRLAPDWKKRILPENIWLEDLLREAIQA